MKFIKQSIFLVLLISSSLSAQSYNFNWQNINYVDGSGGGHYTNIDGSGIDFTLSGFVNDYISYGQLKTGNNGGGANNVQHVYTFTFSEPISFSMKISDVNVGYWGPFNQWNDKLVFSGNPIFLQQDQVQIIDSLNTVIPLFDNWGPFVEVRYENVTSISITHGLGAGADPGFLLFPSFTFSRPTISSTQQTNQNTEIIVFPNPANQTINLSMSNTEGIDFKAFNFQGIEMNIPVIQSNSNQINTSNWPNGMYLLQATKDSKNIFSKKIEIIH